MTSLKALAKKLRNAADIIDDLLQEPERETREMARKIIQRKRGFHHKGKHWTQKPENKARLRLMLEKAAANRKVS